MRPRSTLILALACATLAVGGSYAVSNAVSSVDSQVEQLQRTIESPSTSWLTPTPRAGEGVLGQISSQGERNSLIVQASTHDGFEIRCRSKQGGLELKLGRGTDPLPVDCADLEGSLGEADYVERERAASYETNGFLPFFWEEIEGSREITIAVDAEPGTEWTVIAYGAKPFANPLPPTSERVLVERTATAGLAVDVALTDVPPGRVAAVEIACSGTGFVQLEGLPPVEQAAGNEASTFLPRLDRCDDPNDETAARHVLIGLPVDRVVVMPSPDAGRVQVRVTSTKPRADGFVGSD